MNLISPINESIPAPLRSHGSVAEPKIASDLKLSSEAVDSDDALRVAGSERVVDRRICPHC